jgi:hypothetical protein
VKLAAAGYRALWLAALPLLACVRAPSPAREAPPGRTRLHYRVELAPSLTSMDVELCFEGTLWGGLIPGNAQAFSRLRGARWLSASPHTLRAEDGLLEVPEALGPGCLRYRVSLDEGGSLGALGNLVQRVGDQLVCAVPAWLWRPRRRADDLEVDLRFSLPPGVGVSVAFQPEGDGYRLDPGALAFDSYAAFGDFSALTLELDGTRAQLALLGELPSLDRPALQRWLRAQVELGAESDGRFPTASLQILLMPLNLGSEPFGNVARGGGASVLLLVPTSFDAARLTRDWVLPHELSHLLLPFLAREDAWLAEGFATYYQEVLRARAGLITPAEALDNVASALRSARREASSESLCTQSRRMHQSHGYRAVYWGGAGHWLNVDVALRRAGGPETLDTLLSWLRSEARISPPYRASELLAMLNRRSGTQLFSALEAHCQSQPFPEFESSLRALGVGDDGSLASHGAALRDALFAPRAPSRPAP